MRYHRAMEPEPFEIDISRHIWDVKYRWRDGEAHDRSIQDTWRRVARALARVEAAEARERWAERFYGILEGFRFLPGGRILAGAGTGHRVTLFNCFVMGRIEDSLDGIFEALKEGALTMQQGGGVGYDFSTLRPRGFRAHATGGIASGPVSFMAIWDAMCATLLSTGARRGAMMATLRCDHPDIEAFIDAKSEPGRLTHFNLSVQVTDAFMAAVRADRNWELVFPLASLDPAERDGETLERHWPGMGVVPCRIVRRVRARELWDRIMRATYDHAEPGVLFIDRINQLNNLRYREDISATNPCGEVPLPPYGACDLGSINLTRLVREPFTDRARFDFQVLADLVPVAVRLMDDVIDASRFPLPQQARVEREDRRIGLGITGLADALLMLGLHYGSQAARDTAARIMRSIRDHAYRASVQLAREKGPFPAFEAQAYLTGEYVRTLPEDIRQAIARYGIRNSHLNAIAPTGTISLLANNVSSGIEPVFDYRYRRRVLELDGTAREYEVTDYAYRHFRAVHPHAPLPAHFVTALELPPERHLAMQAALQPYVDNSISKTINIPEDYPYPRFREVYAQAFELGLKGCTTYRPNPVTGAVLEPEGAQASHCCHIDREAD